MSTVPHVDVLTPSGGGLPNSGDNARLDGIELRLLDAGAKAKENLNREADQRYFLRWIAVFIVIVIIFCMGLILSRVTHLLPVSQPANSPAPYIIAVYVAPIVSITTLTLSLLVAAFRGFKDGDEKTGMSAIAESAKASGLGN